jgi:hypothetical protein
MKNGTPDAEAKQAAPLPVFEHVDAGIYRYTPNGNYYEQSAVNGKRTWRSLKTRNLKFARERLHQHRAGISRRGTQGPAGFLPEHEPPQADRAEGEDGIAQDPAQRVHRGRLPELGGAGEVVTRLCSLGHSKVTALVQLITWVALVIFFHATGEARLEAVCTIIPPPPGGQDRNTWPPAASTFSAGG